MRHETMNRRRNAGFTLLEVLVALVVLGLLMATLAQGMRIGLGAMTVGQRIGAGVDGLEATERTLRALLGRAAPSDTATQDRAFTGLAQGMAFTTTLPEGLGTPLPVEADVSLLVADGHRLELRWRPHHRNWIVTPPPPATVVLQEGVAGLALEFFEPGADGRGGRWLSSWRGGDLPRLVRIRVTFPDGDRRHWPDIVVATMRERPPT
jgi:general secretion pathway protein J